MQQQHMYEIPDSDEFATPAALRVAVSAMQRDESNGSFVCRGQLLTGRGIEDVQVRSWRKSGGGGGSSGGLGAIVDAVALRAEVKALRVLSRRCVHVARVMHMGALELSSSPMPSSSASGGAGATSSSSSGAVMDLLGLATETSDLGTLDRFTAAHLQMQMANAAAGAAGGGAAVPPAIGYSTSDLQSMCVMLVEALMQCHEMGVRHRDIRPQNILVAPSSDKYQSRQFSRGLVLKFANFTPAALLPLCALPGENTLHGSELDRWCAPEVDAESRRTTAGAARFQASSDVWSLGLTFYYLATGGQLPFDSHQQACDAAGNPDYRRACMEKHGLQERAPMLYDLVERLVRPAHMRTELATIRCHPFLWTLDCRKTMLTGFANACTMRGSSEVINNFVTGIDKISPLYVFGADGWVAPMSPPLLALVQPPKLKTDFWWSGAYLLQAVKNQLQFPELLLQAGVYPRSSVATPAQATHAYLKQITDVDFPRLLILLYELGGIHGKWLWDGDEIVHSWN